MRGEKRVLDLSPSKSSNSSWPLGWSLRSVGLPHGIRGLVEEGEYAYPWMNKGSGQREIRPVWNNVQRVNHQNQFVPKAVLTRTGKIQVNTTRTSGTNTVNTARTSGTSTVNTARHNFNRQAVPTNAARKVNTVKPIVNNARPTTGFHKTLSPFRKPFNRTTTLRTNFSYQKVNTAEVNAVSAVGGKRETAVKPSAGCNWRHKRHNWNKVSKYNGGSSSRNLHDYPQRALQNKGIFDSGCSKHMTGNKAYLAEYQDFNGGHVAFGGSKGYITGKGKIKTGKLDFKDVCFVKELQHFNLFSVSQMCDKKNKVLFTDTECLVLSPEFKLPDENQVLLRIPRQNNMYNFNLENIVPSGGKQHNASCKAKSVSSISQPLQLLHMDLFGPTSNRDFIELCGSKGIKREYSNARTLQQNGVAERKNMTLKLAARTRLQILLPNTFGLKQKGPTWLFDLDYLTDSMNYQPVRSENQANKHAGPKEANHSVGTEDNIDAGNSEIEAESAQDYFVLPIWSSYTSTVKSSKAKNAAEALRKEFAKDTEDLLLQAGAAKG
ncbi:ribonuclease H-like domain-containing protein [Tanacetum coccineum]